MATAVNVSATNNAEIDGLLAGVKWSGSVTFSFPDSPSDYPATGYSQDNEPAQTGFASAPAAMQAAINYAISLIKGYTNISISYAGTGTADIQIAQSPAANPTSYAYYPGNYAAGGDIWFGTAYNYSAAKLGNYYFATALHELGHALGLKHSQETGGVANVAVPSAHDDSEYTIMSYRSYVGAPLTGYTAEQYGFSQSYMANDILALQTLYGANYNTQSGNTVYTWSPTTGQMFINGVGQLAPGDGTGGAANRVFETIWDGGGSDTYDLSNYTTSVSINLNPGAWTVTSQAQLAYLGNNHYATGNILNAYLYNNDARSYIDNAIGGSAGDTIVGNAIANNLNGGGGNDTITGAGGNDTIIGGSGTDTAVYSGARANYLITYNSATQTLTIADQRSGSPDGTDTVTGVENFQFADGTVASASLVAPNHAPVVTIPTTVITATPGQVFSASALFSATDADGDTLTYYLYDDSAATNSGHWVVNGTVVPAGSAYAITAAQLAQTTYVAGTNGTSDDLYVKAWDGQAYSNNGLFNYLHVNSVSASGGNHAPVVTIPMTVIAATPGQVFSASSLFGATDADGDTLTYYLYDDSAAANSGHWVVNGTVVPAGSAYTVSAVQLAQTTYVAGANGTSDDLYVKAWDGQAYSNNGLFSYLHVNTMSASGGNLAPVLTIPTTVLSATAGQVIAASTLFSATDAGGGALTYYLYDDSAAANSGHWVVNGTVVPAGSAYTITATQLTQTTYVAGAVGTSDDLYVKVWDGQAYSNGGLFSYLHVNTTSSSAPLASSIVESDLPDSFPVWLGEGARGLFSEHGHSFVFAQNLRSDSAAHGVALPPGSYDGISAAHLLDLVTAGDSLSHLATAAPVEPAPEVHSLLHLTKDFFLA